MTPKQELLKRARKMTKNKLKVMEINDENDGIKMEIRKFFKIHPDDYPLGVELFNCTAMKWSVKGHLDEILFIPEIAVNPLIVLPINTDLPQSGLKHLIQDGLMLIYGMHTDTFETKQPMFILLDMEKQIREES